MKIGEKVICINDSFNPKAVQFFQHLPSKGSEYVIREARPANMDSGVLLEEIRNKPIYMDWVKGNLEPAFDPKRFAALADIKQIEVEEEIYLGI